VFKTKIGLVSVAAAILLFSGCAKEQLLLKTYSAPAKKEEVQKMLVSSNNSDGFLNIEIYDDVRYISNHHNYKDSKVVAQKLIADIKKYITQTNFISISSIADTSDVSLDMKILQLDIKRTSRSIKGVIEIEFNIRKGEPLYTQVYKYKFNRFSKTGRSALPSKRDIFSQATKYLAKKLIKDISPLKTQKLVDMASLPKELEYTMEYAKHNNFKEAIDGMLSYKGDKDYKYYFNLALYYEGYAAKINDMGMLALADKYYKISVKNGGLNDDVVLKGKTKFDNYYELFKDISQQKARNAKNNNNSQYQLLD
jgi:hypothetical protein